MAGVLAAFLLRRSDPMPPQRKYSWEIEEELEREREAAGHDTFEPRAPDDVPVLWKRGQFDDRGKVLPFRSRAPARDDAPAGDRPGDD